MAQVFHDKDFNPVQTRDRVFPDDFMLVAEVDTDKLEDVFCLTNHIDSAWWNNPGVKHFVESRSTSTGDVVVQSDGTVFVVRTMGWTKVGNVQDQPLSFQTGFGIFNDK